MRTSNSSLNRPHANLATGAALTAFDHQPRTRIVYGPESIKRVGELTRELGGSKALLVSDPGIAAAGHEGLVCDHLVAAGIDVKVFDEVRENPTTDCVDACVAAARTSGVEIIIGLGGGSAMDTAKGCNFILTNGGRMQDYWGFGKAAKPMLPLLAIPTTAGTGSECQSFTLIADAETHAKMACGDPKAAPRIALLDPTLTLSQPPRVTACTGIDAIAHAVESAVTRSRTGLSQSYSQAAFKLGAASLPIIFKEPDNLEARGRMQLGAALAGLAIETSMLGAAHAAANPLTAHYQVVHGQAVGILLPHVVRFNAAQPESNAIYAELLRSACLEQVASGNNVSAVLSDYLTDLLREADLPTGLNDCGVKPEQIPQLAQEAAEQWTAQFNPRLPSAEDFEQLYRTAL